MADRKRIVLVGHCGPDSYALKAAVSRFVPDAAVVLVMDDAELERELPTADLLLINRVLDGDYALEAGVDLIRRIRASDLERKPAMMLVSNFPEAQAEAEAAGASPGFGKRDLYAESTGTKLRAALHSGGARAQTG